MKQPPDPQTVGQAPFSDRLKLSRRQLLWGGLGGAAVATSHTLAGGSRATAAEKSPGQAGDSAQQLAVREHTTATVFNTDGSVRVQVAFPSVIEFWGSNRSQIELSWDERIWSMSPSAIVQDQLGGLVTVFPTAAGSNSATFEMSSGPALLILQARNVATYPHDLLNDVVPTSMTVDEVTTAFELRTAPAAAWGAELTVAWTLIERQYVPSIVQVTSTGPFACPAGLKVEYALTVDGAALVLDTPGGSTEGSEANGSSERRKVLVDLPASLLRGEMAEVLLPIPPVDADSRPNLSQTPTVALVIPEPVAADCRATGAYASAPISDSGTALSTFVKIETA